MAIVDIGYNFAELFVFQNKELAFVRKLPVAGQNFTEDMSQVLVSDLGKTQLNLEEAERVKKEYDDLIPLLEAARYPLEEQGNTMYLI